MSRDERRTQLLDVAAELLVERGEDALTIERLAECSGVSKALPYVHFDNSDEVLVAVYWRAVFQLGSRVTLALESAEDRSTESLAAAVVASFLDTVNDLGPILSAVASPGSRTAALADPDHSIGERFTAELLHAHFDLSEKRARIIAPILQAALLGAARCWINGPGTRKQVEPIAAAVIVALVEQP